MIIPGPLLIRINNPLFTKVTIAAYKNVNVIKNRSVPNAISGKSTYHRRDSVDIIITNKKQE